MRNTVIATTVALGLATASHAADVSADLGVDFTQNADDKIVAATTIELGVTASVGVASLGLEVVEGDVTVDTYSIGTTVGPVSLSYGDQGDLLDAFEGKTEAVGGQTLTDLDDEGESLMVGTQYVSVMLGFTDVTEDITDIAHVQATAGMDVSGFALAAGVDYNLDSEETTLLGKAGYTYNAFDIGLTGTYQIEAETLGYEADVTYSGITAFVNGDKDDMLQNVGAGYYGELNGMGFYGEVAYSIDTEEFTPAAGISFSF